MHVHGVPRVSHPAGEPGEVGAHAGHLGHDDHRGTGPRDVDALGEPLQRHLSCGEVREVVVIDDSGHSPAFSRVAAARRRGATALVSRSCGRARRTPRGEYRHQQWGADRHQRRSSASPGQCRRPRLRRLPRDRGLRNRRPALARQPDRCLGGRRARGSVPGHGGGTQGIDVVTAGGVGLRAVCWHKGFELLPVVPGFELRSPRHLDRALRQWRPEIAYIASVAAAGMPVASVCVGAFLLGEVHFLDGPLGHHLVAVRRTAPAPVRPG